MTYDSDLRWLRRIAITGSALLVIETGNYLMCEDWLYAIANALFTVCMLIVLSTIRAQQRTRDNARIALAAAETVIEEYDE